MSSTITIRRLRPHLRKTRDGCHHGFMSLSGYYDVMLLFVLFMLHCLPLRSFCFSVTRLTSTFPRLHGHYSTTQCLQGLFPLSTHLLPCFNSTYGLHDFLTLTTPTVRKIEAPKKSLKCQKGKQKDDLHCFMMELPDFCITHLPTTRSPPIAGQIKHKFLEMVPMINATMLRKIYFVHGTWFEGHMDGVSRRFGTIQDGNRGRRYPRTNDPQAQPKMNNEQWQALFALHRTLLHEHHDFFSAVQHPSASPAPRLLASK